MRGGVLTRFIVKALLYPEFLREYDVSQIHLRHKRNISRGQRKDSWFIPESTDDEEVSTTSTFGLIEFVTGRKSTSSTEYESLIDHGDTLTRKNLAAIDQQSSFENNFGGHMACEDLVNVDDDLQIKNCLKPKPVIEERHSMPTYYVGNRFNAVSATEIYIPNWKDRQDSRIKKDKTPATPHSSQIENQDHDENQLIENLQILTPPEAFQSMIPMPRGSSRFSKHSIDSDKRMSSHKTSLVFTPRSSDSGMAGSVTISSPDYSCNPLKLPLKPENDNSDSGQYECTSILKTQISDNSQSSKLEGAEVECSSSRNHAEIVINIFDETPQTSTTTDGGTQTKIYRTGMYAHWWKKEQLPIEIIREIVMDSRCENVHQSAESIKGSGKLKFGVVACQLFLVSTTQTFHQNLTSELNKIHALHLVLVFFKISFLMPIPFYLKNKILYKNSQYLACLNLFLIFLKKQNL